MTFKHTFASAVTTVALVALYHHLFVAPDLRAARTETRESLERLGRRMRAVERAEPTPSLEGPDAALELERMGARLRAVESRVLPSTTDGAEPEGETPRVILEARKRAQENARAQDLARFERQIERIDNEVASEDREEAAAILAAHAQAVRDLYEGKENADAAERKALRDAYDELVDRTRSRLGGLLSDETVRRLLDATSGD